MPHNLFNVKAPLGQEHPGQHPSNATPIPFQLELRDHFTHPNTITYFAMGFLALGLIISFTALSFNLWQHDVSIAGENALLEIPQDILLLMAAVIQLTRAWHMRHLSLSRDLRLGLGLLCLVMLLREVDIDTLGSSPYWETVEQLLRATAVLAVLGFIAHLINRAKLLWHNQQSFWRSPALIFSLIACAAYLCGWFFDKKLFGMEYYFAQWCEEMLELYACLLLFIASFATGIKTKQISLAAQPLLDCRQTC